MQITWKNAMNNFKQCFKSKKTKNKWNKLLTVRATPINEHSKNHNKHFTFSNRFFFLSKISVIQRGKHFMLIDVTKIKVLLLFAAHFNKEITASACFWNSRRKIVFRMHIYVFISQGHTFGQLCCWFLIRLLPKIYIQWKLDFRN